MTAAPVYTKRQRVLMGEGENVASPIQYTDGERDGVHEQKRRLHMRGQRGKDWDGSAANDNIAWPLATALIREGNVELLKAAVAYRKLNDAANSPALLGMGSSCLGSLQIDDDTILTRGGKVVRLDLPKRKTSPVEIDETGSQSNWSSVPKAWNGDDPVNNMIDSRRMLSSIRMKLGPLCEAVEMAVVDGSTYKEIGAFLGASGRTEGTAVGRAAIHLGLASIKIEFGGRE